MVGSFAYRVNRHVVRRDEELSKVGRHRGNVRSRVAHPLRGRYAVRNRTVLPSDIRWNVLNHATECEYAYDATLRPPCTHRRSTARRQRGYVMPRRRAQFTGGALLVATRGPESSNPERQRLLTLRGKAL
jgi:hypothetical protein